MFVYGAPNYALEFKLGAIFRVGQFGVISVGLSVPVITTDKVDHVVPRKGLNPSAIASS